MAVLGAAVLLLSLRYGLRSITILQWSSGFITIVAGLAIGAGFVWVARKDTTAWVLFLTNLVAIHAGLTAFSESIHAGRVVVAIGWRGCERRACDE